MSNEQPLRDRTPNPLATLRGSLEHAHAELRRLAVRAVSEEDREHYVRAGDFVARALAEIE